MAEKKKTTKSIKTVSKKAAQKKVSFTLSADEMKPFFEANGIDMETIGFPLMNNRSGIPTDSYHTYFKNVKISPVKISEKFSTVITGKYETQAKASYQDESKYWHPGSPEHYSFKIQEGKLKIKDAWEILWRILDVS